MAIEPSPVSDTLAVGHAPAIAGESVEVASGAEVAITTKVDYPGDDVSNYWPRCFCFPYLMILAVVPPML
jgi:hypothetical protein